MPSLGFKVLSPTNLVDPDPVLSHFVSITPQGSLNPLTVPQLTGELLSPQLNDAVPNEVRALFEVARGCICYGSFFYPLFMLGTEQLFRVVEAAVAARCGSVSPAPPKSFARRIALLVRNGVIPESDIVRWKALRELRNFASHPTTQSLMPPGYAIDRISKCADAINSLFPGA